MFFGRVSIVLLATSRPVLGFIRFGCGNNLVEERADPIVAPGQVAGHVHKIAGGSGFGFSMDYAQARSSSCSSCPIKEDFSNYWTPKLYYQYQNGTFQSVPTVGDSMADLNGGMTVYYLQRGPAADSKTLKAFPEGFRMLAGDSSKRSFSNDFAGQAISYSCLGGNQPETNAMPNYNCPGGLRAQVFFPSCWDGVNLDSTDHKSHLSYPSTGAYNSGGCPSTHPVQLISLFFEVLYDTNQFASMWYGQNHPFVFANGDPTGYGFHGDFVNGWDIGVLQNVVDQCDDLSAQGVVDACSAVTQFTQAEQNACRLPSQINEQVAGYLPALPGCNPVTPGPGPAAAASCPGAVRAVIGSGPSYFTDATSKGWAFQGCATDGSTRTLTDKTTLYTAGAGDTMTVETCLTFCQGYTFAGLEYGQECYCGNTVAADRAPQAGILGECNMKCKGDSTEFCGGPAALSLYKACASTSNCQNVPFEGSTGAINSTLPIANPVAVSSAPYSIISSTIPSWNYTGVASIPTPSTLLVLSTSVLAGKQPSVVPVSKPAAPVAVPVSEPVTSIAVPVPSVAVPVSPIALPASKSLATTAAPVAASSVCKAKTVTVIKQYTVYTHI
ncbi:WSC-domain-containing protein [Microthyrium microscopicum]|uniref:WSC-domain-containing protein n=1 Tax=Microthyrium microscopicum TaxID=703497 RepID=A0A6A6U7E2_9PEZI|nr:WSC-domain-containing protein [Microthyrium microscopicum]